MKTVYLSLGLIMAAHTCVAATSGTIGVQLTIIAPPCLVDSSTLSTQRTPGVVCGTRNDAQPKITEAVLSPKTQTDWERRLITVEW
ncbi:hypothetical protein [Erwinia sp. JUb26]|uniref:hypothetical protein n=1 Tax=Erwinia sp. JUb26 TaxID=2485126 RepID=UPI000F491256|nr:hypothetical protein [Erwinia sp. JUb26]ROR05067.1 hypothetical protein EC836_11043 [Erwinia sp. JUb26]